MNAAAERSDRRKGTHGRPQHDTHNVAVLQLWVREAYRGPPRGARRCWHRELQPRAPVVICDSRARDCSSTGVGSRGGGGLCAVGQRSSEWKPLNERDARARASPNWKHRGVGKGLDEVWIVGCREKREREGARESERGTAACRGRASCAKVGAVAMLAQVTRCPPPVGGGGL